MKNKMKNVAILLTSEPQNGGEHQYLVLLAESLVKCDGKYFHLTALCCNRFWKKWCCDRKIDYINIEICEYTKKDIQIQNVFPGLCVWYNMRFDSIGRIIRQRKISLLICGQQGVFLPKYVCNVIRPVHDLMHRYEPQFEEIRETSEMREVLFKSVARLSDYVLVDSELGKKQFIESYGNKVHFPHIAVLPFVVPRHIREEKEKYIATPTKYIFYPAQFWEHKNHMNLVKAIKIAKEQEKDICLVLVGSEKNTLKKVKRQIAKDGLEKNIFILGFVADEQITYLYKHANALIMPSYFGPTNIPPLEAMALGCPVIVSNKYAMGEQVGDAGLLFDPDSPEEMAECILKVWNDEEYRKIMIQKGYEQINNWTEIDFKKKFISIVRKCIQ